MYRFVFTTNVAFGAALLLCLSLLLQPVASAYAQESLVSDPVSSNTTISDTPPVDVESIETEPPPEVSQPNQITPDVIDNGDDDLDAQLPVENLLDQEPDQNMSGEDVSGALVDSTSGTSSTADQVTDDVATTTLEADVNNSVESNEVNAQGAASSTSEQEDPTVPDTSSDSESEGGVDTQSVGADSNDDAQTGSGATATTSVTESILVSNVQTDNQFSFNKNECIEVEDGSFYCQKISYDKLQENDLFSAPDATGDLEIFVVQDGVQMKITDNTVDDASPYYDSVSNTLVWHRLIDDRYQIISYDIKTGKEHQLTDTAVNNMEPTRNGDYTVWQRWVQNNWEIVLDDGVTEQQLTSSIEHDIAPHIRGDLIIWNVRASDGTQSLMTYDIGSKIFNEIKDTDGVSVANPRMLVMYEAQYQNGDTIMKGFDLVTGEIISIDSIPRELPTDIPNPETTGEVRALPTNPHNEEDLTNDTDLDTDDPENDEVVYGADDLVLTATTSASTTPVYEVTDFDLDLRPVDPVATSSTDTIIEQAAIPDVVIPMFDEITLTDQASSTQDN